jgi:DNA-binding LytR/AlgR family response regulator
MEGNKIKIGIVEDEMIIVETIALTLEKLGYAVVGKVGNYADALEMVKVHQPDLVLLDINLGSKKDGIDLATEIKDRFAIPIIFLTANADAKTVNRAKDIHPIAYIVKPFSSTDLFSAIEIGWTNYNKSVNAVAAKQKHVVLKVGSFYEKIMLDDISYMKNDHIYIDIFMVNRDKLIVRATNQEMLQLLPADQFFKVNRSCIVNINQIKKIDTKSLFIADQEISITKEIRQELLERM